LLTADGRSLIFSSLDQLDCYAKNESITIDKKEGVDEYDLDYVLEFSSDTFSSEKNSEDLLNCWNLFDDLGNFDLTTGRAYKVISEKNRDLHEKLLFGTKLFGEQKMQVWDEIEIEKLKSVLKHGLLHFIALAGLDPLTINGP